MTKLCSRGKSAAKRKFAVYPSAYANAYASKICAGKIKDPSGVKRKDWKPKGAYMGKFIEVEMNDKVVIEETPVAKLKNVVEIKKAKKAKAPAKKRGRPAKK